MRGAERRKEEGPGKARAEVAKLCRGKNVVFSADVQAAGWIDCIWRAISGASLMLVLRANLAPTEHGVWSQSVTHIAHSVIDRMDGFSDLLAITRVSGLQSG